MGICSARAWRPARIFSRSSDVSFLPFSRAPSRASRDHDEVELLGGSVSADLDRALVIGVERESVKPELIAVYLPISQFVQEVCAVAFVNESLAQSRQEGCPERP